MKKYFVVDLTSGQKYGPADISVLNQWLAEGRLTAQSTLEDAETGERIIASHVPGLSVGPTPPSAPPSSGVEFTSPYPRSGVEGTAYSQYPPGIYFEFIGRSWEYIKANLGMWVVATIVFYMASFAVSLPMSFIGQLLGFGSFTGAVPESVNIAALIGFQILSTFVQLALVAPLSAGMVCMALEQIDGKPMNIATMFKPFTCFIPNALGGLLSYMVIMLGFICCLVPGFYLLGRLAFVNVIITEQRLSASDGFMKSWETMAPYAWPMFGLYFVASLVSGLGVCACGIGLLVTVPFLYLTLAQQYRVLFPAAPVSATGTMG